MIQQNRYLRTCAGVDTKATHLSLKNAPKEFKEMLQQLREKFGKSDECVHEHSCVSTSIEVRTFEEKHVV